MGYCSAKELGLEKKFVYCAGYDGPIAGNKDVSQCISGGRKRFSEFEILPSEFIQQAGYEAEDHLVKTEDGYLLTMNRIPGPPNAPVVLLQHGFPATSFDWVVLGKKRALAFLLADKGYDVWLGNTRGGLYSRCHVRYTDSQYKFWNFSFQEMATYDLPAEINYIEKTVGNVDMYYAGHSMGSTISYILAIEKPDLASKFKIMFGLGPIARLNHVRGIVPVLAPFSGLAETPAHYFLNGEIFKESLAKSVMQDFCSLGKFTEAICLFFRFTAFGFDYPQVDYSIIPLAIHHGFVPSAFKIADHYAQIINNGKFQNYDYGFMGNLKAYHTLMPPEYDLTKIKVPLGLFYAENDFLSAVKDVEYLKSKVTNVKLYHKVALPDFNHSDHVHGKNASDLVYDLLISTIQSM